MKTKNILAIILLSLVTVSCIDEYYFGKSDAKKILSFKLEGQVGNTIISQDSLKIKVTVGASSDLGALVPMEVKLSTFATLNPPAQQAQDYTSGGVDYTVIAEDGSSAVYIVYVEQEGANPQLENSNFNAWHTTPKGYPEPGSDETTIWASGNSGVVTLGDANTIPLEISSGDFAVKMETLDMGTLAGLTGQRVAAGSIFTGYFELNLGDPESSAHFGTAFTAKPSGFSVDYAYIPGEEYMDGKGNILEEEDMCDIYLLLEDRSGEEVKRIATGWFRSGEEKSDAFERISVDLVYGELPAEIPDYQKPVNGIYGEPQDEVTHISFICTSSYLGNKFKGAIGSILVVDNLELVY